MTLRLEGIFMCKSVYFFFIAVFLGLLVTGCSGPSKSTLGPDVQAYKVEAPSRYSQINIDGVSSTDIQIKVKQNDKVLDNLPPGMQLVVNHTHSGARLIIP